jgi:hypothetical protein
MGQFSVEKPVAPGSVLSGNQQHEKLSESAKAIKGCRKTPAFALLNFPQHPMQRYKTFIFPVRQ